MVGEVFDDVEIVGFCCVLDGGVDVVEWLVSVCYFYCLF